MKNAGLNNRKTLAGASLVAASALMSAPAHAAGFAVVFNGNDSGFGSLRFALENQQASHVLILPSVDEINIGSTLNYDATRSLTIFGTGQTVTTDLNTTLLSVNQGADLRISNLNFQGKTNFYSIENRGDLEGPAGKGIFVDVRDDQTGVVEVELFNVSVSGVANHGIHISDCSLADECGGGSGGGGEGSPASIYVELHNVHVNDVGQGKFDADGFRVDDRGEGDIYFYARHSSFTFVGADGVELDEGNAGSVYADIAHSDFSNNGNYCDPALLSAWLPSPDEAEFSEEESITLEMIPAVSGSPDDRCFEREVDFYDSGFVEAYEFGIDVDDGIDLDEAGEGSLVAYMFKSSINDNFDEGVDFDEEDGGDIEVSFIKTEANGNTDDGYKMSEEGQGDVLGTVKRAQAFDNGGKGFVFEEADDGDLSVNVKRTQTSNNDDSDDTGIEAVQEDQGMGTLKVRRSEIADGIDTDGVDLI